jgi:hypothetical protein
VAASSSTNTPGTISTTALHHYAGLNSSSERLNLRWAVSFILVGILLPALAYVDPSLQGSAWLPPAFTAMGVAISAFGFYSVMRVREQHQQRKWAKRREAEKGPPEGLSSQDREADEPDAVERQHGPSAV